MRFLRYLDGAEALVAPLLPRLDDAESEVLRLRAELADASGRGSNLRDAGA